LTTEDDDATRNLLLSSEWKNNLQPTREKGITLKMVKADIPTLNFFLVQHQQKVLALQPRHSLEDYFLQITSGKQHVEAYSN